VRYDDTPLPVAELELITEPRAVEDDCIRATLPSAVCQLVQSASNRAVRDGLSRVGLGVVEREHDRTAREQRQESWIGSRVGVEHVGLEPLNPLADARHHGQHLDIALPAGKLNHRHAGGSGGVEGSLALASVTAELQRVVAADEQDLGARSRQRGALGRRVLEEKVAG
jgi:hypothetical protein